jgi:1-acyl-sn-glycerol-3-phosphate acyltransferase
VTLRRIRRAAALVFVLSHIVLLFLRMRLRGRITLVRRALWLHNASRLVLRALGVEVQVKGLPPVRGLAVANHLSYFDILIISATVPCFFVAKKEIEGWPYFGWAARAGGAIFLDRTRIRSARVVADEIAKRLNLPVPVLLFPEGTSTDGAQVLRFRSRLIDPATEAGAPIAAVAIRYLVAGGAEERDLCWFGKAKFLPHAWKVMGVERFTAQLCFGEAKIYTDRHTAAERARAEIVEWRDANAMVIQ